jgi:hypothetical protein
LSLLPKWIDRFKEIPVNCSSCFCGKWQVSSKIYGNI